jgi:hypothetical protein
MKNGNLPERIILDTHLLDFVYGDRKAGKLLRAEIT